MAQGGSRPADSRDMYAVHTMFRREFAAMPALVRSVPAGDRERVGVVADHVALVVELLHYHHGGEDAVLWPTLLTRAAQDVVAPIVELMESQHQAVDRLLQDAQRHLADWRETADRADSYRLADAVEGLLAPLDEHLAAEEERVLPLIDRHMTADEWAEVGNRSLGEMPPEIIPVLFGMLLLDATDDERTLLSEAIPSDVFAEMSRVGPPAYQRHRETVFAASRADG